MKRIVKLMVGRLCYGIAWGCTCLVFVCLIYRALGAREVLWEIFENFGQHTAGAVLVGIAFGSTSILYQFSRPSLGVKVAIHFAVGMGVLYAVAFYLKWIPFYSDRIGYMVLQFLGSCLIFAVIWCFFYFFNRSEARRINHRLRELEEQGENKRKDDKGGENGHN